MITAFIVLVGTKADLEQKRVVSKAIGEQLAESKNVGFVEVSSKTGQNIENLFRSTAEKIFRNLAYSFLFFFSKNLNDSLFK